MPILHRHLRVFVHRGRHRFAVTVVPDRGAVIARTRVRSKRKPLPGLAGVSVENAAELQVMADRPTVAEAAHVVHGQRGARRVRVFGGKHSARVELVAGPSQHHADRVFLLRHPLAPSAETRVLANVAFQYARHVPVRVRV